MEKAKIHTIDASGAKLGRVATEAATVLLGKNTPFFAKNVVVKTQVVISNASKISIDEKKKKQKMYKRYSGYPGGQKVESLAKVVEKKGTTEILKRAVYGMLPSNKLRNERMKLLSIHE